MEEIERLIHDFILREFLPGEDPNELQDQTRLITGGILDSISTLKLVTFLEDHFGSESRPTRRGLSTWIRFIRSPLLVAAKRSAA